MKKVKDEWNKFIVIVKNKDYSSREAVLFTICSFLVGLIIGMVFSPKKHMIFGSYNGSCSGGCDDNGQCNCNCDSNCDCDSD